MTTRALIDLGTIDLDHVAIPFEEVQAINPQRHEFVQIDRICHFDPERRTIAGIRDIKPDEFWVRGHMPGRPIFPGVLMIEAAAQLCAVCAAKLVGTPTVYGFGGVDEVRFRRIVSVGERLVLVGQMVNVTPMRSRSKAQGFVGDQLVFEASIFGIALSKTQSPS